MLKVDVIGEGKLRYYDTLFPGYYVQVERKTMEAIEGCSGPVSWGMVYLTLPEDGPHALDHDNTELLADALAEMLKAAATIARLMDNSKDSTQA